MVGNNILIVDDDRITAKAIEFQLTNMGCSVVSIAESAKDAVKKARLCSPDLLLMDINLGDEKDGIQAVEEIYQESDIPVIYVTAYADDDTINRAKKTHPLGYVNKPIREADLRATVILALEQIKSNKTSARQQHKDYSNLWKIQTTCDLFGNISNLSPNFKKMLSIQGFNSISEILPRANKKHIRECLNNQKPQLVTGKRGMKIFSWEYFPTETDHTVNITITDITVEGVLTDRNIQQTILLEALNHLATAVVLINENLNIFYTNKSADRLLKNHRGLKRNNGYLNCHHPETTAELHRVVLDGSARILTIEAANFGKPLHLLITPLQAHKENYGHNLPIAILFAFEIINTKGIEDVVRSLYGLSPAEARLIAGLILTPNLKQVAESLGITLNTARTHLKHIYTKTNTNRLSALIHLMVTGPVGTILHSNG